MALGVPVYNHFRVLSFSGNEFEYKEKNILMYLGNMPANVTKV